MDLTEDNVIQIIRLLNESRFESLHLEMDGLKLVINKHDKGGAVRDSIMQASVSSGGGAEQEMSVSQGVSKVDPIGPLPRDALSRKADVVDFEKEGMIPIRSPMLGTFYRAPNPTAPAFVEVGTEVTEDDTVCIMEVMKLYTAIKAGLRGRIAKICAEDGEMVEYNQVLFLAESETP